MLDYGKWMQEQVGTWKEKKDQTGATENASQHSALQGRETAPASCRFPPAARETVLRKQISHIPPWAPTVLFPRGVPKCYLSLVPLQLPAITFGKDFSCSVRKQWEWAEREMAESWWRKSYWNTPYDGCCSSGIAHGAGPRGCVSRKRQQCHAWCPPGKSGSSRMRQQFLQGEMWDHPQPYLPPAETFPVNTTQVQGFPW